MVYNDSVVGETPILIKYRGIVRWIKIEDLCQVGEFEAKIFSPIETFGIEIWSDFGWTCINKIIRHKTTKKIYRVLTDTGMVDVTEDHSLLDQFGREVRPIDVKIGDILLHRDLPKINQDLDINFSDRNIFQSKQQIEVAKIFHLIQSNGF